MLKANLTGDEQLVTFRGRCRFKRYLPSNPGKYGMNIWWIADSETKYSLCGLHYLGKEGNQRATGLGKKVVEELSNPYQRTNRNITCDYYFTDINLARNFLGNGLTIVGTVKKNKRFIHEEFLLIKSKEKGSSMFGFTPEFSLVSYIPQSMKAVILLSTMHYNLEINKESLKPMIIKYYNSIAGVYGLDQMLIAIVLIIVQTAVPLFFL